MTITIPMRAARDAFAALASLASTSSMPLMENVLITTREDGTAELRRMAGDISMAVDVPCEGAASPFTLPSRVVAEILGLASGEALAIDVASGGLATLTCGLGESYDLVTLPSEDYPLPRNEEAGATLVMPADDLAAAIKRVSWAVPGKDHRRVLMGLHLREHGGSLAMTGTDGKKLARLKLALPAPEGLAITLPPAIVAQLAKGGPGEAVLEVRGEGRTIHASIGNRRLWAGLIEGRYPDVDAVIPKSKASCVVSWAGSRALMVQAIKRAAITAEGANKSIVLDAKEGGVALHSACADVGKADVTTKATMEGEPVRAAFNHALLAEAIDQSEANGMDLRSESAPAVMHCDEGLTVVLMPIKLAEVAS